jgi:hypothetical protein
MRRNPINHVLVPTQDSRLSRTLDCAMSGTQLGAIQRFIKEGEERLKKASAENLQWSTHVPSARLTELGYFHIIPAHPNWKLVARPLISRE